MMYDNYGNNGMGSGFGWIFMFFMMAFVVLAVVLVVHHLSNANNSNRKEDNPLEVLKHRYAKGEIDKKQFDEIKKDLQ
jgi:putative membrane protein